MNKDAQTSAGEEIRRKYLYRRLVMTGKAKLGFDAARRLVGPDCAYHLYSTKTPKKRPR
jgi:hypothetical protein